MELGLGNNQRALRRRSRVSLALGVFFVSAVFSACDSDPEPSVLEGDGAGEAGLGGTKPTGGAAGSGGRGGTAGSTSSGGGEAGTDGTGGSSSHRGGAGGTDAGSAGAGARAGEGGEGGEGGSGESGGGGGPSTVCGDGAVEGDEACDDRNADADDGCSECAITPGWACDDASPSVCVPRIVAMDAGGDHTCAVLGTGKMLCWGRDGWGDQLGYPGYNNIGDDEPPAAVGPLGIDGTVRTPGLGGYHTCALLESNTLRCWGDAGSGQLGYGNTNPLENAALAGDVDAGGPVLGVVAGEGFTCALLATHTVRCWGYGPAIGMNIGWDSIGDNETPAMVDEVDIGRPVAQLAAGMTHACALLEDGAVRCWGDNLYGQLGYPNVDIIGDDETPASAGDVDVGGIARQISAGRAHTCALLTTGKVRCWGSILGYGHRNLIGDDEPPASAGDIDLGVDAQSIVSGGDHVCALTATGALHCWGVWYGRYGNTNPIGDDELPSSVGPLNIGGPVELVAAGNNHTCVVLPGSKLRCWGDNTYGQLGYGDPEIDMIGDNETPGSAGFVPYY